MCFAAFRIINACMHEECVYINIREIFHCDVIINGEMMRRCCNLSIEHVFLCVIYRRTNILAVLCYLVLFIFIIILFYFYFLFALDAQMHLCSGTSN